MPEIFAAIAINSIFSCLAVKYHSVKINNRWSCMGFISYTNAFLFRNIRFHFFICWNTI